MRRVYAGAVDRRKSMLPRALARMLPRVEHVVQALARLALTRGLDVGKGRCAVGATC